MGRGSLTRRRDRIGDRTAGFGLHVRPTEDIDRSLGDWDDTMHTLAFLWAVKLEGDG